MIFDLVDNEPRITIEGVHIPEYRAIWEADDSEDKIKASQTLAYVYHMADRDSPYAKESDEERSRLVREDFLHYSPTEEEWIDINACIRKHKQFQETPETRLLDGALFAVNKFTEYFYSIDFEERDEKGRPLHLAKDLAGNLEKIGKIVTSLQDLKKIVAKSEDDSSKRIGKGAKPSMIMD